METASEARGDGPAGWTPGAPPPVAEAEVLRLAQTFAVTPDAARLAVARVGTDFRALQRELGGRR